MLNRAYRFGLLSLLVASSLQADSPRLRVEQKSPATCLAWSSNGQWIAAGANDGAVRIFQVATGLEVHRFDTDKPIDCLALSPDGKAFAIAQAGQSLSKWDIATSQIVSRGAKLDKPQQIAFTADGQTVLGAGFYEYVRLEKTGMVSSFRKGKKDVGGFGAVGLDGQVSGWCDATGQLVFWDTLPRRNTEMTVDSTRSFAIAAGGKMVAVGGDDMLVHLWNLATKKKTLCLSGLTQPAVKLAFSKDAKTLAALAADGASIRIWDLDRPRWRRQVDHDCGAVEAMALSPDGKSLATVGMKGNLILLWNVVHQDLQLELSEKELARLWNDFAGKHYRKADAAWRQFAAAGDKAVPFLKQQIWPLAVPHVDKKLLDQALADLDSNRFADRERATRELTVLGELAVVPLQRLLEKNPSGEAERRGQQILKKNAEPVLPPARLCVLDTIELLEQMQSTKAISLMEEIEQATLIMPIRLEARRALERVRTARDKKERK